MKIVKRLIIVFLCMFIFVACATQRPVLYPNDILREEGSEVAQAAIDDCMRLAAQYSAAGNNGSEIAQKTAENAVVGGASGAAAGAVFGNAGKGAAAGAAGAGAATVTRGFLRSKKPDPVFRRFVERCLREKGYEPIGWN
jgi:hypothetical protein